MSGTRNDAVDRIVETGIYLQTESRRIAREECARHGITATQLNVLKLLQAVGDLSRSELSRRMAAKNSTVTGNVDRRVTAGLVLREQSAEDRRLYAAEEVAARGARAGLWGMEPTVPPWEFRRSRRGEPHTVSASPLPD